MLWPGDPFCSPMALLARLTFACEAVPLYVGYGVDDGLLFVRFGSKRMQAIRILATVSASGPSVMKH